MRMLCLKTATAAAATMISTF